MFLTRNDWRDAAEELADCQKQGPSKVEEFGQAVFDELTKMGPHNRARIKMRDVYEAFVDDGAEQIREIHSANEQPGIVRRKIMESAGATSTENFKNIVGQITFAEVKQAYENPVFIADQLQTTVPASTMYQEIVPGVTRIGDVAEALAEKELYPVVGVSQQYVTAPAAVKKGFRIEFTEELLWEDKTGQLLEVARKASEDLGIEREKTCLRVILGITTTYSRNGSAAIATYSESTSEPHAFDNLAASNALTNYQSVDAAEQLLQAITDPDTGEPLMQGASRQLLVPLPLANTARFITLATSTQLGSTTSSSVPVTVSINPLVGSAYGVQVPAIHSNAWVGSLLSAASIATTTWFYGNFKEAFRYREVWPLQLFEMPSTHPMAYERDVIAGFKVRRFGSPYVFEPRYVCKATA